ncbi:MAG: LysE family translocator [Desulfobacteraceae bacterium]|jgi:RhtB (resistance to homoserine/threonine) family protein
MELSTWLFFLSIALVAIISPGPAVLLSVTNSLTHGFTKSVFSSLGNITGIFVVSSAAALGLGAVLQTSILLFTTLKIFGAIYLIYLGIRQWRSKHNLFEKAIETSKSNQGIRKSFVQGLLVAISNPKAILFFTALFPQFIDLSKPILVQFIILTTTFMLFSFIILVGYAISAHSAKGWFAKRNRATWLNRISGTIFISFGLGILRLRNRSV